MFFHKTQSVDDRLRAWRKVRTANYKNVTELLEQFAEIKLVDRYLDYYTPRSWPNIFDIVAEGHICQTGLTLMLTGTLIYKEFISNSNIVLPVISNSLTGKVGAVLKINNDCYNFIPGKIVDYKFVEENSVNFYTHTIDKWTF